MRKTLSFMLAGTMFCLGIVSCNTKGNDASAAEKEADSVAVADKKEAKVQLEEPAIPAGFKLTETSGDGTKTYQSGNDVLAVWSIAKGTKGHTDEGGSTDPINTLEDAFEYRTILCEFTGEEIDFDSQKKEDGRIYVFAKGITDTPLMFAATEMGGKFYIIELEFPDGDKSKALKILDVMTGW